VKTNKTLFIVGSSVAHGAEQVLMDVLSQNSFSTNMEVLGPDIDEIRLGFINRGVKYHSCPWLRSVGAGRTASIAAIIKKCKFWILASFAIFKIATDYDLIIGNNSGDALWAMAVFLARKPFYLWVHDDNMYTGLAMAIKATKPFVGHYIACSNSVERNLKDLLGSDIPITIIFNGLSTIDWRPRVRQPVLSIGWIGSIEGRKDPLLYIDILQKLQDSGVNFKASMVYRVVDRDLEKIIKEKNAALSIGLDMIGAIQRDKVHSYLEYQDLIVVTSLSDPLPTVVLEAYRAGTPILARNISSLKDMVDSGATGELYESAHETVVQIQKIRDGFENYSRQARIKFERSFSIEEKVIKMQALLCPNITNKQSAL
jgi:glycosyltransferase involved in cell wall biosynthesis